jgi:oligopeptide/dipeptide ABC transporter ATP-binding protein
MSRLLLSGRSLALSYRIGAGRRASLLRALDHVDIDILSGESLGLLGESGSGKSTLGRCLAGAIRPDSGSLDFDGVDMIAPSASGTGILRREIQMVFQDPAQSLNPRMTIEATLAEHLRVQRYGDRSAIAHRIETVADLCGLPAVLLQRYPHELSGGQLQRVAIARAISTDIRLLVADEPVSALDGSTRAQIINLFRDLHHRLSLTSLIISHDLSVLAHVCRRIAVMYLGRIVEVAPAEELLAAPRHPYARALLAAVPVPDPVVERRKRRAPSEAVAPAATDDGIGCRFRSRCPIAGPRCAAETPELRVMASGHAVACHNI